MTTVSLGISELLAILIACSSHFIGNDISFGMNKSADFTPFMFLTILDFF